MSRAGVRHWLADRIPLHGPISIVVVIAVAGFVRVLAEHWRQGTGLIGGALLVAALTRILLPEDRAGLLAVRGQWVDVLCYAGLGTLIVMLAATIRYEPFLVS